MYLSDYDKTGPRNMQRYGNIKEDAVVAVAEIR